MGPLPEVKVIELAARGPGPFCGQLLADMGADVVLVERIPLPKIIARNDVSRRGKSSIALDLKQKAGVDALLRLIASADVLIEGFRPGVMERLGLGPQIVSLAIPGSSMDAQPAGDKAVRLHRLPGRTSAISR